MAERQIGQLSFTDGLVNEAARANAPLQRMSELVDWSAVEALLSGLRSGSMGAPAYPSLALFKALLLQQWYGLSDPGLEEALLDRFSFRRFLGLSLSEPYRIIPRCGVSASNWPGAGWRSARLP